jgi:predicted DNA-binding WGR domain protein
MSDDTFHKYLMAESSSGGKFWEVLVEGSNMNIRFGKVGQTKAWKTTAFGSPELATREATKKMNAKLKKGYAATDEVPEAGEVPAPRAPMDLDELFGELRSTLEGKVNSAAAKTISRLYEQCWKLDRVRTEEELDTYLLDKLTSWPPAYFSAKVKQVGLKGTWPKSAEPLRDIKKLKDAPSAKLTKGFKHLFDGNYMPSDDADLTPYLENYWVGSPIDFAALVQNPIVRRLESLYFDFDQISEYQSYSNLIYPSHIKLFLCNMPRLRHLLLVDSWQTRGFGPMFQHEDVQCKLHTFGSWESGFAQGDLIAMAASESLNELTHLRAGFSGYGGKAPWVEKEIEALAESPHITQLTRFDLNTDHYNDVSLAEMLVTSKNFSHLDDLMLDIPSVRDNFMEVLCPKSPANGLKLKTFQARFITPDMLEDAHHRTELQLGRHTDRARQRGREGKEVQGQGRKALLQQEAVSRKAHGVFALSETGTCVAPRRSNKANPPAHTSPLLLSHAHPGPTR